MGFAPVKAHCGIRLNILRAPRAGTPCG